MHSLFESTADSHLTHIRMLLHDWPMQANTRLQQAIQSREAAANYPALEDSVLTLVADLNRELKKAAFA